MSRLKLHSHETPEPDDNPMRFPAQWFESDASGQAVSIASQMLELAEQDRDLIGTISRLQDDATTLEETLGHALHLTGHDDPPAAA